MCVCREIKISRGYLQVVPSQNLTKQGMQRVMKDVSKISGHKDAQMCVVIMSSHGNKDVILSSDLQSVTISSLLENFSRDNCPGLAGKPKLFIINACR